MLTRALIGLLAAACVAFAARRARSLSASGAIAAWVVGTLAVAAGWSWGALLILYFVSVSLLSHAGRVEKERRTSSIVEKGGERDATQVFSNGLVFAIGAIGAVLSRDARWMALGVGSLAASAADTWATEIGTLYGGTPRSILTLKRLAPGTSGGVSLLGTFALVAGASFIGVIARLLGWDERLVRAIVLGGIAGAFADSLLGATLQARRWCDTCRLETERIVHDCGTTTRSVRGVPWLDNDMVNLASGAIGGLLAAVLAG
jgi:uncharacterized protein (TIGR00297 family)